jgi:hypothetical protein
MTMSATGHLTPGQEDAFARRSMSWALSCFSQFHAHFIDLMSRARPPTRVDMNEAPVRIAGASILPKTRIKDEQTRFRDRAAIYD